MCNRLKVVLAADPLTTHCASAFPSLWTEFINDTCESLKESRDANQSLNHGPLQFERRQSWQVAS